MLKSIIEKVLGEISGEFSHVIVRQVTPIALPSFHFSPRMERKGLCRLNRLNNQASIPFYQEIQNESVRTVK